MANTKECRNTQSGMSLREAMDKRREEKIRLQSESMPWPEFKEKLFEYLKRERSADTVKNTEMAIAYIDEVIRPFKVHNITPLGVQIVKEYMQEKGLDAQKINCLIQCIKSFMHIGESWDVVAWQDWDSVSKLEVPKKLIEYHSEEELNKLLDACPTLEWKTIVRLATDAGLRSEEIMALRWEDVEANNNMIYVNMAEKDYVRTIPTTQCLKELLAEMRKVAKNEFVINAGRDSSNKNYLNTQYRKIAQKAEIQSNMQKLRHTFACQLLKKGLKLDTLAKLMGIGLATAQQNYEPFMPALNLQEAITRLPPISVPPFC